MYKKWLLGFFTLSLLVVAVIEVNYQQNSKKYYRHAEDYAVNKLLVEQVNKEHRAVIMGDSVTHWAIEGVPVSDDVYDLSVTSSMTMIGQYMLLNRYLKYNKAPKDLYFFFIPEAMMENTEKTAQVVETVFDEKGEAETIKMLKLGAYDSDRNYFFDRVRILKFWKQYLPHGERRVDIKAVEEILKTPRKALFKDSKKAEVIHLNDISKHVIKELVKLTKKYNINLHFVLEPLPSQNYQAYQDSDIPAYIKENNIALIDFRDIYVFDDKAFYDGVHISGLDADIYVYMIDKKIVPFLKQKAQ